MRATAASTAPLTARPIMRAGFIMAALDAGVSLRDVKITARHADPRTTTIYERRRENQRRTIGRWRAGRRVRSSRH